MTRKNARIKAKNAHKTGLLGERIALFWLFLKGYKCLNTRYKTPVGEIDLVVQPRFLNRKTICFVEVKHHMGLEQAAQSISNTQKQRIVRASQMWMQNNPAYANHDQRFDALLLHGKGLTLRLQHLKNAWSIDQIGHNF
ncbi:MAG: YraN family protein [Alphaproteobacteria bacterium]